MLVVGEVSSSTYLPIGIGVIIGAVGSLVFIMRTRALSDEQDSRPATSIRRRLALRSVLIIYAIIAWICLAVAVTVGEMALIVLCGVIVLIASIGLMRIWRDPRATTK